MWTQRLTSVLWRHKRQLAVTLLLLVGCCALGLAASPRARFMTWYGWRYASARFGLRHVDLTDAEHRMKLLADTTTLPLPEAHILVEKSARELHLMAGGQLVKTYRVGLGDAPLGAKTAKGDERTPEGVYHICTRRNGTKDHLFLGLNYPNAADAQAALSRGTIDQATAQSFQAAERTQRPPVWTSGLGGAIGIHGGGARDWTNGCIALADADIEELFVATTHWTKVEIHP